jgi:hypothetical protein
MSIDAQERISFLGCMFLIFIIIYMFVYSLNLSDKNICEGLAADNTKHDIEQIEFCKNFNIDIK